MGCALFSFRNEATNRKALANVALRGGLMLIAVVGLIPPAVLLGQLKDLQRLPQWQEEEQRTPRPLICQTVAANCPPGWRRSISGTKCLTRFPAGSRLPPDSYSDIFTSPCPPGSTLATISTDEENLDVHAICGDDEPCWIGLFRKAPSTTWYWEDKTPVSFTRWADGEPSGDTNTNGGASISLLKYNQVRLAGELGMTVLLINIVLLCACGSCFVIGLAHKSSSCLLATGLADVCYAIAAVVAIVITIIGLSFQVAPNPSKRPGIANLVLACIELLLLCAVSFCTYSVREALQDEAPPPPRPAQELAGSGAIVLGHPVGGAAAAAAAEGGPPPAAAQPVTVVGQAVGM